MATTAACSNAKMAALIHALPNWFVVDFIRAFVNEDRAGSCTPEGVAMAKDFILNNDATDVKRAATYELVKEQFLGAMRYQKSWMDDYPAATKADADVAMLLYGDCRKCDDCQWWPHFAIQADGPHVLCQVWLKDDPEDAMPVFVLDQLTGTNTTTVLLNKDRLEIAEEKSALLQPFGYVKLNAFMIEPSDFKVDVADLMSLALRSQARSDTDGDFGTGFY